jgi:hypothetical protein
VAVASGGASQAERYCCCERAWPAGRRRDRAGDAARRPLRADAARVRSREALAPGARPVDREIAGHGRAITRIKRSASSKRGQFDARQSGPLAIRILVFAQRGVHVAAVNLECHDSRRRPYFERDERGGIAAASGCAGQPAAPVSEHASRAPTRGHSVAARSGPCGACCVVSVYGLAEADACSWAPPPLIGNRFGNGGQ